eukprot:TRINITY_DN6424_c0_g1_i1.p1 TRINITY_DN6424_c0_g1~~TRINITY_DN6424_c0_g1_i1.p1  ORF type:complete len:252 (+),score=76.98 TRINITY_DN6424_c0_g1_i1:134-889(+)
MTLTELPSDVSDKLTELGFIITSIGWGVTAAVPAGLLFIVFGRAQEGMMLFVPLILCITLAYAFIKKQKAGLRKGGVATWGVARLTLWPTVAFNGIRDLIGERKYYDEVYPGVVVGGAPWDSIAETLIKRHNIKTVVNCCEEYKGPVKVYQEHKVCQLRLNCIDFVDVPLDKILAAVDFLHSKRHNGGMYIHCKSGKGRAVTVATAYLAKHFYDGDTEIANLEVKRARPTAIGTVHCRPAMLEFASKHCGK